MCGYFKKYRCIGSLNIHYKCSGLFLIVGLLLKHCLAGDVLCSSYFVLQLFKGNLPLAEDEDPHDNLLFL